VFARAGEATVKGRAVFSAGRFSNSFRDLSQLIEKMGIEALARLYSIRIQQRPGTHAMLFHLLSDKPSPSWSLVVRECRGLLVSKGENWSVVCLPYPKYFFYLPWQRLEKKQLSKQVNERQSIHSLQEQIDALRYTQALDWGQAISIEEHLDGALVCLYFHDGKWNLNTLHSMDASELVANDSSSLGKLFWSLWNSLGYDLPQDSSWWYTFELISQAVPHIVKYKEERIVLTGVRDSHSETIWVGIGRGTT
jgi:hypothetical protein